MSAPPPQLLAFPPRASSLSLHVSPGMRPYTPLPRPRVQELQLPHLTAPPTLASPLSAVALPAAPPRRRAAAPSLAAVLRVSSLIFARAADRQAVAALTAETTLASAPQVTLSLSLMPRLPASPPPPAGFPCGGPLCFYHPGYVCKTMEPGQPSMAQVTLLNASGGPLVCGGNNFFQARALDLAPSPPSETDTVRSLRAE